MARRPSRVGVLLAVLATVTACGSSPAVRTSAPTATSPPPASSASPSPTADDVLGLGTMTPYPAPASPSTAAAGLVPVFVEDVGRHGSRTPVDDADLERVARLWRTARDEGALTPLGTRLGPAVQALRSATDRIGLGRLTGLGRVEQEGIGRREGTRLGGLFVPSSGPRGSVEIVTSGRTRAAQSATSFVAGLRTSAPGVDVRSARKDPRLLHFDTTDATYADFIAHGPWRTPYRQAVGAVDLAAISRQALERLYTPGFVDRLDDPVAEADGLWGVYRAAPALAEDVQVDMTPFLTRAAAGAFAFDEDARYFYSRGPGLAGDDRSYAAAQILLDDFFDALEERLGGGSTVAIYRFAHAEEIVPFAALLGLLGNEPLPADAAPYSWDSSDFRTAQVAPLSANVAWTVWRDGQGQVLVSVLHDEKPTTLRRGCQPASGLPGYYALDELRRCLPRSTGGR